MLNEGADDGALEPISEDGTGESCPPKAREKGDRFKSGDDPLQQLEEIEKAQRDFRDGKNKKRIDSIEKSRQRAKDFLKNLKNR